MSIWSRLFNFQRKDSAARQLIAMQNLGRPITTPKNYKAFSEQAYQANVIAYKCVSIIARSCASISWELYQETGSDKAEIEEHPLLDLLDKPNPMQARSQFFESLFAYYLISGNTYINKTMVGSVPMELWTLRPDMMSIIPGPRGIPLAYQFKAVNGEVNYPVDQVSGESDVLHVKTFHPTNDWYGLSPIEASVFSIDQHNEAAKWNLSMLQNDAKPSGALIVKQDANNPLGTLPSPEYENLKEMITSSYGGAKNTGKIMLLEGGLDWKQMGLSQKDMDWIEGRNMSSRDIALAFGVPPIMLNIPGDSTFSNYKEARLSLYEDTIIPLMTLLATEFNKWLVPYYGDNLCLEFDIDDIEALSIKRSEKFNQISTAGHLTINEKRLATGYDAVDGGDIILIQSSMVPLSDLTAAPETPEPVDDNADPEGDANDESADDTGNQDGGGGDDGEDQVDGEPEGKAYEHVKEDLEPIIELKQINVSGRREKIRTWKTINRQRNVMTQSMYHDLKDELKSQLSKIKASIKDVEPRLAEFAAMTAITKSEDSLKSAYKKHLRRNLEVFALPVLNSGKDHVDFETKTKTKFDMFVESFIESRSAESIKLIQQTTAKKTRRAIKDAIQENIEAGDTHRDLSESVDEALGGSIDSRAMTIARTEVGIASNYAALEAAKALDVPNLMKEWVSVNDDRTRDNPAVADHVSVDGALVPIDEKFHVNPDSDMIGPGDQSAPPEQIINCRCVLTFQRNANG